MILQLYVLDWSCRTGALHFFHNCLNNGTFKTHSDKIFFFFQHSQLLYYVMLQQNESFEYTQAVSFEFIKAWKDNGTNYLLTFDVSWAEISNAKAFVFFIKGKTTSWMRPIYIKHNFFLQNKSISDVELQNTNIDHFKSHRDVMQFSTFCAQLGPRSDLFDWYRDATSAAVDRLLVDLSLRTVVVLRYCTNSISIP